MGLNDTPAAGRLHIGFFGVRNAGKSSLVNAVTGQELSVVSDVLGTTTDPVKKSMELLPLGPVVIVDTPGIDDEGDLGALRVKKAKQTLAYTDIAVLVADAQKGLNAADKDLIEAFKERKIPFITAFNKADLLKEIPHARESEIFVSAKTGYNINELKDRLAAIGNTAKKEKPVVSDLLRKGGTAVLVVPIDKSAPKGRLILPQQQTIRDLLDGGDTAVVCRESELEKTLKSLATPPDIVITDSQVFESVAKKVPSNILLTSFSILFARLKGELETTVQGAAAIDSLKNGDKVLICEGCTHHRQCEDIGTVKLPKWLSDYTKKELDFAFTSGGTFPENLDEYALIIHCGGCMLTQKEVAARFERARMQGVAITNYGIAIAHMHGILKRAVLPFNL